MSLFYFSKPSSIDLLILISLGQEIQVGSCVQSMTQLPLDMTLSLLVTYVKGKIFDDQIFWKFRKSIKSPV